jgi:hypothetical protein
VSNQVGGKLFGKFDRLFTVIRFTATSKPSEVKCGTNGASDKQAVICHKDSLASLSQPFGIAFFIVHCLAPEVRASHC